MVTRAQVGTVKPNPRFHGHTSHISPLPMSPSIALSNPNWRDVMYDEYNALIQNSTWILVLKPPNVNMVRSMWLFRHKYHVDGSLSRYKARLVANVLHQIDVKNAFLNGDLSEIVYMYQLPGFVESRLASLRVNVTPPYLYISMVPRAHMDSCNPTRTPVDTESKLSANGDLVSDPTLYRSLAGGLQYLTFTRPGISYAIQQAEYRGVANVVSETAWLRNLLRELHTPLLSATLVYK
ncbi:ribonuclease H-like domain-containing protein [Tanacetum coccineum]